MFSKAKPEEKHDDSDKKLEALTLVTTEDAHDDGWSNVQVQAPAAPSPGTGAVQIVRPRLIGFPLQARSPCHGPSPSNLPTLLLAAALQDERFQAWLASNPIVRILDISPEKVARLGPSPFPAPTR